MKRLFQIGLLLLVPVMAHAQQITVTGTVEDANGSLYAGGSGVFTLVPQNQQWVINQYNPVPTPVTIAQLDSFGRFSVTLTNTAVISPSSANPQWQASFCSAQYTNPTTKYCFAITPMSLTSSQDITATIQPQAAILPTGGGGGGTVNPGTQYKIALYPNSGTSTVVGPSNITTDSTKNNLNVPGNSVVAGNSSVGGPRPYIDVTAPPYNADPTFTVDSTTAIQAAITAACSYSLTSGQAIPGVYFPPGQYKITQTQTGVSATAPIFTICANLYLYSNGSQSYTGSGATPPQGALLYVEDGASPNNAPVFLIDGEGSPAVSNVTFESLAIAAYNQAIWSQSSASINIINCYLNVDVTGQTDNTPLKVSNTLWFNMDGGELQIGSATLPTILFTGETPLGGEQSVDGIVMIRNVETHGGGFEYVQRVSTGSIPANFVFRNVVQEQANTPLFAISEAAPGYLGIFLNVLLDNDQQADSSDGGNPLVSLDISSGYLKNVTLINSTSQQPDAYGIDDISGDLVGYLGIGPGTQVLGASAGTAVGNGTMLGVEVGNSDAISQKIDSSGNYSSACAGLYSLCAGLPALRLFTDGMTLSQLALDSSTGILFGDGVEHGYASGMDSGALGDTDIQTAAMLPPTGFSGTATTGGSLAAGTYYGLIWSSGGSNASGCQRQVFAHNSTIAYATGVTISGANNAISFTWTAPQAAPAAPAQYCFSVDTTPPGTDQPENNGVYLITAPASSFLYTGQSLSSIGTFYPENEMVSAHRFTYNSLGVNTISPRATANLDVNGTAGTTATVFSNLPTCNSTSEGLHRALTDSTTNTWGATVTGSGSDHVEAYCDGTNWTVEAQ